MSSTLIIGVALLLLALLLFLYSNGYKIGIIFFIYALTIGILSGLASIYFSDNMKIILSIVLITIAIVFSYPPSKKFLINKIKQILKK